MKKTLLVIICLMVLFSLSARAQFVQGKYEEVVGSVDGIVKDSFKTYANERAVAVDEEKKSQAQRYNEMIGAVDNAIVGHYNSELLQEKSPAKDTVNGAVAK